LMHISVRHVLHDLFASGVSFSIPRHEIQLGLVRVGQRVVFTMRESPILFLGDFLGILQRVPFPYGSCPSCRRVFVRSRRQKYCSRDCTSKGVEQARQGTRRDYMRKYMANRRARQRRVAAKRRER
jgi:hypothetical protein